MLRLKLQPASKYQHSPIMVAGQPWILVLLLTASISLQHPVPSQLSVWSQQQPSPAPFNSLMAFVSSEITVLVASPTTEQGMPRS